MNICHFVFGLQEQNEDFLFCYYIAVYSCYIINNPDIIYFYYHYEPYGIWWNKIKLIPCIKLEKIDIPTHIGSKKIKKTAHKADWVRMNVLYNKGGVYLDIDTICIKPWKDFFNHDVVLGKQIPHEGICNAIMFSKPKSEFFKIWLKSYEKHFKPDGWSESSIILPLKLSLEYPNLLSLKDEDVFFLPHYDETHKIFKSKEEIPKNLISLHLWESKSLEYMKKINDWDWAYENSHTMYGKMLLNLIETSKSANSNIVDNNYYNVTLQKSVTRSFHGFWDSDERVSDIQLTQIQLWAKSLLYFHNNANVFLYTKKYIIPEGLINIDNLKIIYIENFEELFIDTPLINYKISHKLSKPELSDIIRLVLLYKNGGTWLDIDDVVVRKFPNEKNIIGTFLWKNKKKASYWGSNFNLVDGTFVSNKYKDFGFHIQNDPMINWEKGNKFLYTWMENITKNKSVDWGQKLPTEIIRKDPNIIKQYNVTLLPQHHILLHPAFGSQEQFGNRYKKGPMFPPFDLRITGKVNYDDLITKDEFWDIVKQTLEKHDYCCVKNSSNTGIKQNIEGKDKRWFIGYLCDLENIEEILNRFNILNGL